MLYLLAIDLSDSFHDLDCSEKLFLRLELTEGERKVALVTDHLASLLIEAHLAPEFHWHDSLSDALISTDWTPDPIFGIMQNVRFHEVPMFSTRNLSNGVIEESLEKFPHVIA